MKATLTSMNPPHTTNIFEGRKIIEWRTFKMPEGLHYVYETLKGGGKGMVIGTMEISRSYSFNSVDEIPEYLIGAGCVSREFLEAYSKGKKLFANCIFNAKLLEAPKPYTDFKKFVDKNKRTRKRNVKPYFTPAYCILKHKPIDEIRMPPQSYMYIEVSDNAKYDYINT